MNWNTKLSNDLNLYQNISNKEQKEEIAKKVAKIAKDGDVIGFGSGSTSYLAVVEIAKRIKNEGLIIKAIPTSKEIEMICGYYKIPTTSLLEEKPNWGFDGTDEIDNENSLIKGRGGALLREKLVMAASEKTYILADETKFVQRLGEKFAVPIEIIPSALHLVESELSKLKEVDNIEIRLAVKKDGPVITEHGNILLDVTFNKINKDFESKLKSITGVVETGLFIGYNIEFLKN